VNEGRKRLTSWDSKCSIATALEAREGGGGSKLRNVNAFDPRA
jgi:hypothetical protein